MTRFLSEVLQAPEPFFRQGLHRLEAANGHPSTDIRFTSEVQAATNRKLLELGLDPSDTTAEELYRVLQERVKVDDAKLTKTLRTEAATHISAEAEVVSGMIHVLQGLPESKRAFAMKPAVAKRLLKQQPPKKALKSLGYRSVDSFLKHESPVSAIAAAWLVEGDHWRSKLIHSYKRLAASDFEDRKIGLFQPDTKRWRDLAEKVVADNKHNLMTFRELGALVFLPLPSHVPPGGVTMSLSLALHELNEIRASATFLKLCQVRSDFGEMVQSVATDEPRLSTQSLDQPVPWNLIQRYYAKLTHHGGDHAFEPHIQLEDMVWHPVERSLSAIEPSLAFWHDTAHLGVQHSRRPVSMNILDVAANACNNLPFEHRITQHFQKSLWHELLLRYLRHNTVEQTVANQLEPEYAPVTA